MLVDLWWTKMNLEEIRQKYRKTERQKDEKTEIRKDRKMKRQKDEKTKRQKGRNMKRQKDKKTQRWKDRKTKSSDNGSKGRVPLPNRMNFQKNSTRPSTPTPHFRKIMLQFFYDRYGCIYGRKYDGQIVWNACTRFPEMGTILRGEG